MNVIEKTFFSEDELLQVLGTEERKSKRRRGRESAQKEHTSLLTLLTGSQVHMPFAVVVLCSTPSRSSRSVYAGSIWEHEPCAWVPGFYLWNLLP
jgi:hypothetical protein